MPKVLTKKALQNRKASAASAHLHPDSRRAKQLQRVDLREKKLAVKNRLRRTVEASKIDRHIHVIQAMPEDRTSISLAELHQILVEYISRNDEEVSQLKEDRKARSWRKQEPKSKLEVELEATKEKELEEYRSGFVLPDLTVPENVILCRQWLDPTPVSSSAEKKKTPESGDPSFFPRIRLIRIFSGDVNQVVVESDGARAGQWGTGEGEVEMSDAEQE